MLNQSTYLQLDLTTGEPVSLTGTVGCEVRCMDGEIWITEENGGEDISLKPGDSFRLTHPGKTIIESVGGVGAAHCRLYPAELSHSLLARTAQKIRHWLFGRMGGGLAWMGVWSGVSKTGCRSSIRCIGCSGSGCV